MAQLGHDRLVSLDAFRGMTIAGMILVNNPGSWGHIYPPLEHAEWHGLTPTDLVFPFFLFIVGIAISLALGKRAQEHKSKDVYPKIIRRCALMFLIGLGLNAFPSFEFSTLRIPGVLQRIAVCYLFASLIFLHTSWRQQVIIAMAALLGYWIVITLVPVPGCEVTSIDDKACNLAAYLDRLILGENHIWMFGKVYDPEGILSTVPSLVTTLSGVLTGTWLKTRQANIDKVGGMFFFGLILLVVGWMWSFWFPFNKSLWTSSYVVHSSGVALCFLAASIWLIDIKGYKTWSRPFVIFGVNALALYIGADLLAKILYVVKLSDQEGDPLPLKDWVFNNCFLPLASPVNASLFYAISFVFTWLFVMWLLYRKQVFIKV